MAKVDQLATQAWGLIVAQGVIAILAGIALLFWPGISAAFLALLFGLFVLIWGIVGLVRSLIGMGKINLWWLELLFSILLIGVGVFFLRNTALGVEIFIVLIGLTLIVRGLVDMVEGFFSKDAEVKEARPLYIILGVIGLIAGVATLAYPVAAGVAFIWVAGLYALLYGSILIAVSLRTRSMVS